MIAETGSEASDFREMGIAAVHLLRGVLYADDGEAWDILLTYHSDLCDYFACLGLVLVVDEADGLAYLKQMDEDEQPAGYNRLPKVFRRTTLSYDATLLCVLLRDEFRKFEDEDLDNERCIVEIDALREVWRTFFPTHLDDVQLQRRLSAALTKLEKLKFVRPFQRDTKTWEIRRILKSRLPIEQLENLRQQLAQAIASPAVSATADGASPVQSAEADDQNG